MNKKNARENASNKLTMSRIFKGSKFSPSGERVCSQYIRKSCILSARRNLINGETTHTCLKRLIRLHVFELNYMYLEILIFAFTNSHLMKAWCERVLTILQDEYLEHTRQKERFERFDCDRKTKKNKRGMTVRTKEHTRIREL